MPLIREAKDKIQLQDYSPRPTIKGVVVVEIKRFAGEDGDFSEIVRLKKGRVVKPEELAGFEVRQINDSQVVPGTIKAWHLHQKQDEIWFVHPSAKLIVGLLDLRQGSKTAKGVMRLSLGDGKAHLLYIPRGVAHGLANPYLRPVTMTYLVNNWFDGSDEWRLPYDFLVGKGFWEIQKG